MGLEHRRRVYAIPPGEITTSERLVLLVLADQTNDERMRWVHDLDEICDKLGGVSREWLRKQLASLEAGFWLERGPAKKRKDGTWMRRYIDLTGLVYGGVGPWLTGPTPAALREQAREEGRRSTRERWTTT